MRTKLIFCLAWLIVGVPYISSAELGDGHVLMSSTIGPIDAGIVSVLEEGFEKDSGIRVRHVGAGTGEALKIAQQGSVDLVMVHAKALEEKFVSDGFGTERIPLMYNDFVIVGPADDPAGIKGMTSATGALKQIAVKGLLFISRGDMSGTHAAEKELWTKAGVTPSGAWYEIYEKGKEGNAATLKYTDEKAAYTLIDRATWLSLKDAVKLPILVEKDEVLLNYISLIPVSPKKFSNVNYNDAIAFTRWLTDPDKGQKVIQRFGVGKYGSPLFFPNSAAWHAGRTVKK
jgi:tungstate transport system substrate-binding protein